MLMTGVPQEPGRSLSFRADETAGRRAIKSVRMPLRCSVRRRGSNQSAKVAVSTLQSGEMRMEKSESSHSTDEAGERDPKGASGGKGKIGSEYFKEG